MWGDYLIRNRRTNREGTVNGGSCTYLELVSCLPPVFSSFLFVVPSLKANLGIGVAEFDVRVFFSAFDFTLGFKYNVCFLGGVLSQGRAQVRD